MRQRATRAGERRPARARAAGFMLLSVLAAALIFSVGMLAFSYVYARMTTVVSHDQYLRQLAPASNAFWGLVQANPAIMTSMAGTWTSSNYSSAPAALQDWLAALLDTTNRTATALPGASVVIATGGDAIAGGSCSTSSGCTATVTISWTQSANGSSTAITRSQTFSYQFGL